MERGNRFHQPVQPELEFLKSLWELGTEEEEGYRTGPPGYKGLRNKFLGIDSGAPYTFKNTGSGLLKLLQILAMAVECTCVELLTNKERMVFKTQSENDKGRSKNKDDLTLNPRAYIFINISPVKRMTKKRLVYSCNTR